MKQLITVATTNISIVFFMFINYQHHCTIYILTLY